MLTDGGTIGVVPMVGNVVEDGTGSGELGALVGSVRAAADVDESAARDAGRDGAAAFPTRAASDFATGAC